jgi:phage terminase small subunit
MFGKKLFSQKGQSTPQSTTKTRNRTPTLKQTKFVEGVIQHGNASRAARDAGYSQRSARVLACRNLKRPDIQAQIKSRIESAEIDTNEIIGTLISHMRADIGNLLADDGSLDLAGAIENGSTHIIKKLTIRKRPMKGSTGDGAEPKEETTYEIVLHDSQAAAWRLARILHLEVKNRPPEARRPTDDELAHRMADLLERARANGRREAAVQRPAQTLEPQEEEDSSGSDSDRRDRGTVSDSDRSHADTVESSEQSHPQNTKNQSPRQTPDSRLQTIQTPDFRLPTPDSRLETPDFGRQTPDFGRQTSDSRLQTPDFRPASGC